MVDLLSPPLAASGWSRPEGREAAPRGV